MNEEEIKRQKIILFDGVCNLCNGSVIFILQRERSPTFRFASIQSDVGKELLEWCGLPKDYDQAIALAHIIGGLLLPFLVNTPLFATYNS